MVRVLIMPPNRAGSNCSTDSYSEPFIEVRKFWYALWTQEYCKEIES